MLKKDLKTYHEVLLKKIKNSRAIISIIGLGYVGLPLSINFIKHKFNVIGIDNDKKKINLLKKGKSYISNISNKEIKNIKFFDLSNEYSVIKKADIIVFCLPTPITKNKSPDLSFINNALNELKKYIKPGQAFSLESTSYPGTTEDLFIPLIKELKLTPGKDCFIIYSPEREDPGNLHYSLKNTVKVFSGLTQNCKKIASAFYSVGNNKTHKVSNIKTAEMTKLLENIYRAVNIGLINELKLLADSLEIDIYEIIKAASTKPFGFKAFYPGPGLGGHCIPIDPFYLSWKAKEYDINLKFIELAGEINSSMPNHILSKITNYLNSICKSIKNSKILILGLSYKKNIDDLRESPSLKIIDLLLNSGAFVKYSDPFFSELPKLRSFDFEIDSIEINAINLKGFDCVILCTDHDNFDYDLIKNHSRFILDTRGRFKVQKNIQRG